jgi:hypothetical protein
MSQRIFENYLGIFGMMEMWVASQLRADRVIPLIEKGIFPRKRILGLVQDGNEMVSGWFWGWQATREEKWRVIPPGFETTNPQKSDSRPKSRKRKMGKIQGVTNLPPLKKSRPRDLVAQGSNKNITPWGNRFQLGFPIYLCIVLPLNFIWLSALLRGDLLYWILFLAILASYVTLTPILLCPLSCLEQ